MEQCFFCALDFEHQDFIRLLFTTQFEMTRGMKRDKSLSEIPDVWDLNNFIYFITKY